MVWFGNLIIGPPGSGKTTYTDGMSQMLKALNRNYIIINLDPANYQTPYNPTIDIAKRSYADEGQRGEKGDLYNVDYVMEKYKLGPNGALVYCMEELVANFASFENELNKHRDTYLLIDCPGQVELYTHYEVMKEFIEKLQNINCRLTCVHLIDSTFCTDPHKYMSAMLVSLSSQVMLELPHVNVLTKIDLLKNHKHQLPFRLDFYAESQDLGRLIELMETQTNIHKNLPELNRALCELIQDYNLIAFIPLDIMDKESVLSLLKIIDTANGFSMGNIKADLSLFDVYTQSSDYLGDKWGELHERYIDVSDDDENDDSRCSSDKNSSSNTHKSYEEFSADISEAHDSSGGSSKSGTSNSSSSGSE